MLFVPAVAALVVSISTTADVSPTLVDRVIDETNAIWRSTGVRLAVQRAGEQLPLALDIVVGAERGVVQGLVAPLGWVEFVDGRPQPRVYLSYANALSLFESARGVVGLASRMPSLERDTYLGRALGRALAHELGHYLLASKTHTKTGLMKAGFTAAEFFSTETHRFSIDRDERAIVAARLDGVPLFAASTTSGSASPTSPRPGLPPRAAARWPGPTPHS